MSLLGSWNVCWTASAKAWAVSLMKSELQLLAVKNLFGEEIPSILMPLGYPGADT
jgi:hypothetical protein